MEELAEGKGAPAVTVGANHNQHLFLKVFRTHMSHTRTYQYGAIVLATPVSFLQLLECAAADVVP